MQACRNLAPSPPARCVERADTKIVFLPGDEFIDCLFHHGGLDVDRDWRRFHGALCSNVRFTVHHFVLYLVLTNGGVVRFAPAQPHYTIFYVHLERVCVCVGERVCVRERESVCVCGRESVCERERECVCVWERECV